MRTAAANGTASKPRRSDSFPANAWGLHDMHGNVFEWVEDCWHDNYEDAPDDGRAWREENGGDCATRVLRGGSWNDDQDYARSANRNGTTRTTGTTSSAFGWCVRPHLRALITEGRRVSAALRFLPGWRFGPAVAYRRTCRPERRWGRPLTCPRVLRGGSWNNNQDNARSANRNRNNPNNRNNNIGFRVVCSSHVFLFLPGPGAFSVPASAWGSRRGPACASGVARRPRFAGRGEEGKMARARPVRTARPRQARPSGA